MTIGSPSALSGFSGGALEVGRELPGVLAVDGVDRRVRLARLADAALAAAAAVVVAPPAAVVVAPAAAVVVAPPPRWSSRRRPSWSRRRSCCRCRTPQRASPSAPASTSGMMILDRFRKVSPLVSRRDRPLAASRRTAPAALGET